MNIYIQYICMVYPKMHMSICACTQLYCMTRCTWANLASRFLTAFYQPGSLGLSRMLRSIWLSAWESETSVCAILGYRAVTAPLSTLIDWARSLSRSSRAGAQLRRILGADPDHPQSASCVPSKSLPLKCQPRTLYPGR